MNKDEIKEFLKNEKLKKISIFEKWKDEIFYMKEERCTNKLILKFILSKDSDIRKSYNSSTRLKTAESILSKFIKKNEGYLLEG